MRKVVLQLIAMSSILLLVTSEAGAVSATGVANGFRLSPVRVDVSVEKGHSVTENIYVTNVNNYDVTARAIVNEFSASTNETGSPSVLLDNSQPAPANSFRALTSAIADVTIPAGKTATVPVVIKVPANANAGGYYGAVRFVSANSNSGSTVTISASVGTIFLVTVPGKLTEHLQLLDFSAGQNNSTASFFTNPKNIQIITRVQNTGNIHVAPIGKINIQDDNGKNIETLEFNNTKPAGEVLPNSTRKYINNLQKQNWFGRYTATAYLGYGTLGGLITVKTSFWVIPVWILALVGLALLLLIAGIIYAIARRKGVSRRKLRIRE